MIRFKHGTELLSVNGQLQSVVELLLYGSRLHSTETVCLFIAQVPNYVTEAKLKFKFGKVFPSHVNSCVYSDDHPRSSMSPTAAQQCSFAEQHGGKAASPSAEAHGAFVRAEVARMMGSGSLEALTAMPGRAMCKCATPRLLTPAVALTLGSLDALTTMPARELCKCAVY